MIFKSQDQQQQIGLLLMRIGLAAALLFHAVPRLFAGAGYWQSAGKAVHLAKTGMPLKYIGLALLIIETAGAISLISGYLFRFSSLLLAALFGLLFYSQFQGGARILPFYSLPLFFVYLGMIFTGPGRYIIAVKFKGD